MDIKEIAQKLAPGYWKRDQWNIEYFDSVGFAEALIEMNGWRNQAHQSQSAFDRLQDQLAKVEQLWQIAQGRCDGLDEKLAKAEQRVAEACAAYITSGRYMILNPGESISSEQHIQYLKNHDIYQANCLRSGEWRKFVKEV